MKKLLLIFLVLVLTIGVPTSLAFAAPVDFTVWDFDTPPTPPTPPDPSIDLTGNASASFGPGLSTESYYQGNPSSGSAWAGSNWTEVSEANAILAGDYFQFNVDLTNYGHITLNFDNRISSTGPTNYAIYYSVNGTDFYPTGETGSTSTSFATNSHDFGGGTAVDLIIRGLSNVNFRIYAWGASGSAGTLRIDNVTFNATTNPTAITFNSLSANSTNNNALFALAAVAIVSAGSALWLRRRNLR